MNPKSPQGVVHTLSRIEINNVIYHLEMRTEVNFNSLLELECLILMCFTRKHPRNQIITDDQVNSAFFLLSSRKNYSYQ